MKKTLFFLVLCLFLIGCGKDYETYTEAEKRKMYEIALEEKDKGNNKKIQEINDLVKKLEIASKNGDSSAKTEWREWRNVFISNDDLYRNYKPEDSKVDLTNLAW